MNQKMRESGGQAAKPLDTAPDLVKWYAQALTRPPRQQDESADPVAVQTLEKIKESLVIAYLIANMEFRCIPLKSFLDGCEKKILLACLNLTQGNQKNAATVLSLKPTALFEKMRKHGIRSQRGRLPGDSWILPGAGIEP